MPFREDDDMKRLGLCLAAVMALSIAVACSSGGGGGSSSGSPTPTPGSSPYTYTINGTGFGGNNGNSVGMRIYHGSTVVYCTTAGTVTGNHFNMVVTSAIYGGVAYHGEVFVDQNANATYDAGEPTFYDPSTSTNGTFVATTSRTWAIVSTTTQTISWPSGTKCP